ncbi:MAG TPA: glycosyltransferase, partial [Beutenbergiaceae bacterium]|nr:glycosyltransferase [Beutenbergiaceae bacterium]
MTTDAPRSFEVTAVVAAEADSPYLSSTLAGLAAQDRSPQRLLIALLGSGSAGEPAVRTLLAEHGFGPDRDNGLAPDGVAVARVGQPRSFSGAVQRALATTSPDTRWLWLLHDDSTPEPAALAELVRTVEDSPSIAVAGAKQVEWDTPDELISVGTSATIDGQRFTGIEDGEIDQGQHDGQEDVYAVGSAGMLIDAGLWDRLGGADPTLGPFGDGADLSRRARLAGHRVVVVPTAVVRHGRAGYYGLRAQGGHLRQHAGPDPRRTFRARREAKVHSAMVHTRLPLVPLVAVVAVLLGPLRALWRVATSELALAADEILAPLVALTRLPAVARARRQARTTQSVATRRLAALRVSRGQVRRQRRHRRMQATAERRAARAPSELEMAERAAVGIRRRIVFAAMLMVTAALSLITLAPVAFSGALTGGALLPVDDSFGHLWRSALAPWISAGSGHPGPPDAFQMLLGAVSAITGGPLGTPVQVSIALVLVLAMPLAAIGAWFAAGAATRGVLVRAWVAGVWAFGPALLLGLGQGRLGAVLAHVALPFVALGIARSLGLDRRDVVVSGMVGAQRATQRPASRRRPARAAKRERLAALAAVGRESGPPAGEPAPAADSDPKTGGETESQALVEEPPETEGADAAQDEAATVPDEAPEEPEVSSEDTGGDDSASGAITTSTQTNARPLTAGEGTRRERRGRSSDLEGLEPIQSNTATEYLPQEDQEQAAVISRVSRAGSLGAAAAAGLALAVAAAGAPVLLPAGLVALLVLAIALGRRRSMPVGRGRLVLVALPALVLLGPLWTRAIATWDEGGWRLLFADPGVPLAAEAGPVWLTLLGWPGQPPLTGEQALAGGALGQWLLLAATATVAAGALFGLVRSGGRGRTARIGWLVAAIGLGTALVSSRTVVAVGRGTGENSGTDELITGWAGPGTSVLLLGLLLATVSALDGLRGTLTGRAFGWRQLSAAALTVLVVLGLGSSAVSWTAGVISERHSQEDE